MTNQQHLPWGFHWRSNTKFVISTVAIGLFTDLFLYGIIVPVLPFVLPDRLGTPGDEVQSRTSRLLAVYAGTSVLSSIPAGWVGDKIGSRQPVFLFGLILLMAATSMLGFAHSWALWVVARALQGMSAAVVWTSGFAMIQGTVGPGKIGQVIGSIFSIISIGELVSPALGGLLYDKAGFSAIFVVSAALIAIDFTTRLLVIDNVAARKKNTSPVRDEESEQTQPGAETISEEGTPFLPGSVSHSQGRYKIDGKNSWIMQHFPIVYCFRKPRLAVALLLSFIQATLIGSYDATVPTEAKLLFGFSSLTAGLLFVALVLPYLVLAPIVGKAVDKHGTKLMGTLGYSFLAVCLAALGLPSRGILTGQANMILYIIMMALNGVGLSLISSPGFVEATDAVQRFSDANPEVFGPNGPFAQLYGFNSVCYFSGLTVGPLLSGLLRDFVGYPTMTVIFAAISAVTALLSFIFIGGGQEVEYREVDIE